MLIDNMLMLEIKDKGGRPPKLSEEMIWEILAIKSEFSAWKQTFELINFKLGNAKLQ